MNLKLYIFSYYYQNIYIYIYIVIITRIVYSGTMNSELVHSSDLFKSFNVKILSYILNEL